MNELIPDVVMMICALTLTSPYYDCSTQWEVIYYDSWVVPYKGNYLLGGYSVIATNQTFISNVTLDRCGNSLYNHELNHLKYQDASHDWYEGYEECDSFGGMH